MKRNITLVDDDKGFSEPLIWLLEQEGYKVTYYQFVDEALADFNSVCNPKPDCIILDVMMPSGRFYHYVETNAGRETGLRLLKDTREKLCDVPIIIVTVRLDLSLTDLQDTFDKRIKAILTKPVTPSEVIETVERILSPPKPKKARNGKST
jgi:DNA-binding response OmpR family regulator